MTKKFHRAALVGVVVAAWLGSSVVLAQGPYGERGGSGLRPSFLPPDRPGGEMSSLMPDFPRRPDADEARNPRRLSPEELAAERGEEQETEDD